MVHLLNAAREAFQTIHREGSGKWLRIEFWGWACCCDFCQLLVDRRGPADVHDARRGRSPFYAVTGNEGTFVLKGLPPGEYTVAARTATFGTHEQKVTIKPGESTTANFTFKAE